MARDVIKVQSDDMVGGMVKSILPAAGSAIGKLYGGPAGGMAGSALGSEVAKGVGGADIENVSSPVARRMEQLKQDPANILRQGKAKLSSMDEQTRTALEPVLDEALKKAAVQRGGTV